MLVAAAAVAVFSRVVDAGTYGHPLADISVLVADVFRASGPGGGGSHAPVSYWCCSMVQSKRSTLLIAQANVKQKSRTAITAGYVGITVMARSADGGANWSNMTAVPWSVDPKRTITYPSQAVATLSGATVVFSTPGADGHGYYPVGKNNTAHSYITRSTDDGETWPPLRPFPGVLGAGKTHGIALRKANTHAGRLLMPRIDDMFGHSRNHSAVAFMLYLDDEGVTWRKGQAMPLGWGEAAIAEMKNGSILWTSRLGPPYNCSEPKHGPPNPACKKYPTPVLRGMARSGDGGETFAETWLVEQDNWDGLCCSSPTRLRWRRTPAPAWSTGATRARGRRATAAARTAPSRRLSTGRAGTSSTSCIPAARATPT